MFPLAPGRLSTMNCCLSDSESAWPSSRAYRSVPPPGDEGTMNFTGREGQVSSACAGAACSAKRTATKDPNPRFMTDRKSTRLNSSHITISYAVFCLKKKNKDKSTVSEKRYECWIASDDRRAG